MVAIPGSVRSLVEWSAHGTSHDGGGFLRSWKNSSKPCTETHLRTVRLQSHFPWFSSTRVVRTVGCMELHACCILLLETSQNNSTQEMRLHLAHCFESETVLPFPHSRKRLRTSHVSVSITIYQLANSVVS